jgi:hypothetical protein
MPDFTGKESAADVLKAVLEQLSLHEAFPDVNAKAETTYKDGIPILRFEALVKDDLGEFVCFYRLDKMTANVFSESARIFDEAAAAGLFGEVETLERDKCVRSLAYKAMHTMILRLMLLQMALFDENFSETMCITAGSLFGIFADIYQKADNKEMAKAAKEGARTLLNATIDTSAKRRRELLAQLLNSLPALHIPTSVGRPQGSTKPEEVKAQEAAEFEKKIEEKIRTLLSDKGKMPTKTAVAKALNMGSLTKEGTNTSLSVFSRKIKNLKIDYEAIVKRVEPNK